MYSTAKWQDNLCLVSCPTEVFIKCLRGNEPPSSSHTTHGQICNSMSHQFRLSYRSQTVIVSTMKHKNTFINHQVLIQYYSDYMHWFIYKVWNWSSEEKHRSFWGRGRGKLWQSSEYCKWITCKYSKIKKKVEKAKTSRGQKQITVWTENIPDNKLNPPFIWDPIWERVWESHNWDQFVAVTGDD